MKTIYLSISAGSGPEECAYAASLTVKVLLKEVSELKDTDLKAAIIESEPAREKGNIRSALIAVEGNDAQKFADSWTGSIQWIWKSTYRPHHKRKNWFVQVKQFAEPVSGETFSLDDIRFETAKSDGPGGQHVNKTETAVRAVHIPTGKSAVARGERSQLMNKKLAIAKLYAIFEDEQMNNDKQSRSDIRHSHWELVRDNPIRIYDAETLRLKRIKKMPNITVKGKHNEAIVYAKALETASENKIRQYLDHPAFANTVVRIMPDVHMGKGTVIGWTSTINELISPSVIGLDIGCGVCACNPGKGKLAFDKLDKFIRKNIPSGKDVRGSLHEELESINLFISQRNGVSGLFDVGKFKDTLTKLCEKTGGNLNRVFGSLGTLGGGNHFIEIDSDENNNRWLLIHSGSRILGAYTAEYHEILALRNTPEDSPIKYLSGEFASDYLADIRIVQHYACVNRALMAQTIACGFFDIDIREAEYIDCLHNYIDTEASIIRKGAISAKAGEDIIIPFSMAEGAVLGKGKGNADWNYSAPHGSGRKKTRTDAKSLSLDEYRKQMRGIWSSVIGKDTLEESPMAYKKAKDVLDYIGDTVEIEKRLKPLYNFKAGAD